MRQTALRIKHYREKAGLTPAQLADFLGVSAADIIDMEKDRVQPTMEMVRIIAHVCHTSTDELLGFQPEVRGMRIE